MSATAKPYSVKPSLPSVTPSCYCTVAVPVFFLSAGEKLHNRARTITKWKSRIESAGIVTVVLYEYVATCIDLKVFGPRNLFINWLLNLNEH